MTCKKIPNGVLCVGECKKPTEKSPCMERHWSLGKACRKCYVDCEHSGLYRSLSPNENRQGPNPPHPKVLLRVMLSQREWTIKELSKRSGISCDLLRGVTSGALKINADKAIKLGKAFGTTPEYWMNLQQAHDLWKSGYRKEREGGES